MKSFIQTSLSMLLLMALSVAYAGNTGKIAGRVIDKETKEPLPGVNVTIIGTNFGASTDIEGRYYILNVPVGSYEVRAAYIGYAIVTVQNVRVAPDLTTEMNFDLPSEAIQLEPITVTAERPLIQKDATASVAVIEAATLQALPVNNFTQAMVLLTGFVQSQNGGDNGIHLRGGRTGEILFMVDGVPVNDPLYGGFGSDVARLGVASLNVLSGGFNAEYGQAQSGIVNVVTQEGTSQYKGFLRFGTDRVGIKSNDWGTMREELSLSGPIPFLPEGSKFFVSGDHLFTRTYLNKVTGPKYTTPGGREIQNNFTFGLYDKQFRTNAKVTLTPMPSLRVQVGAVHTRTEAKNYNHYFKELQEFNGITRTQSLMTNASVSHALSEQTFYELKYSYFERRNQHFLYEEQLKGDHRRIFSPTTNAFGFDSTSNYEFAGRFKFTLLVDDAAYQRVPLTDNAVAGPGNTVIWKATKDLKPADVVLFPAGTLVTKDVAAALAQRGVTNVNVIVPSTDDYFQNAKTKTTTLSGNITSQIDAHHLVKLGFEYRAHSIRDRWISGVNSAWDHITGLDVQSFYKRHGQITEYKFKPVQFAAYVQDKIELEDIIINVGLRYDYLDPKAPNTYKVIGVDKTGEDKASKKMRISPRLGFSHPVTERSKIHFSYGQFFQYPDFNFLYRRYNQNVPNYVDLSRGYEPPIGNPNLKPEVTHAYQVGGEYIFTDDLVGGLTVFYKDTYDYIATKRSRSGAYDFTEVVNLDYANSRGIEISLRKRFNNNYSFSLNYTLSRAEGNADNWQTHFNEAYTASVTGLVPPSNTVTLSWDQPHTLNFDLTYTQETWGVSVIGSFGSGLPYTPTDPRGTYIGEINSGRQPWTGKVDMRIHKTFPLGFTSVTLFTDITNLLNKRNVLNVFDSSGKPDYSTNPNTSTENAQRPHWYGPPRHVQIGVDVSF